MSGVTEIYVCKAGQDLKQGKLETSTRISSREDAECDAEQRCKLDPSIDRIAYYAVGEDGTFKNFLTYKNPRAVAAAAAAASAASAPKPRAVRGKAAKAARVSVRRSGGTPTLFQKVRALFEED